MLDIRQIKTEEELKALKEGELIFLNNFNGDAQSKNIGKIISGPSDESRGGEYDKWYKCIVTSNPKKWADHNYDMVNSSGEYIVKLLWKEIIACGIFNDPKEEEETITKMKILFLN